MYLYQKITTTKLNIMYTIELTFTDFDARKTEKTTVVCEAHKANDNGELEYLGGLNGVDLDCYELTGFHITHK